MEWGEGLNASPRRDYGKNCPRNCVGVFAAIPTIFGANTHKPDWMPGAIENAGMTSSMSGDRPLSSATSSLMITTSGSPSPFLSSPITTASVANPDFINVSIDTWFVPLTNATVAQGLSGAQASDSSIATPSISCALRHSGSSLLLDEVGLL